MPIKPENLIYIREMVRERSAIVLESDKEYLVQSRLEPVAKEAGLSSIDELVGKLRVTHYGGLHKRVVEAMTTNETSFFRDVNPFEALKTAVIPELMTKRASQKKLNIWCGAASSGQEPYTIVMLLREHFPQLSSWTVHFLATDISTEMLDRCRQGRYSQLEVNRGLPAHLLVKYFHKKGMGWQINEELRKAVDFREMNLAGNWLPLAKMDVVFLRNVLIYFDVDTKKKILGKIRQILSSDGYLFLGGAETTMNLDDGFQRKEVGGASAYQLRS